MERRYLIPEGAEVRIRIGGEIEVATVVIPGPMSMRVRLKNGSVVKRKIERDLVEVLDARQGSEETEGSAAAGGGMGDPDAEVPEVQPAVQE